MDLGGEIFSKHRFKYVQLTHTHPIVDNVLLQILVAFGIEVISQHSTSFFGRGERERADTCEDIGNDVFRRKLLNKSGVFCVKPRVPVHGSEVKGERAVCLML